MAAQAATQQRQQQHHAMPYPPLPGSPTLTNPDMILPEYDHASSPDRSESPLLLWKDAHGPDMQYHLPGSNGFAIGPVTPTTPIIYGNGTMLSDIGEVTEVESNAGKTSRPCSPLLSQSDGDAAFRSSPTMPLRDGAVKRTSRATLHERRASMESTSTITTQDHHHLFADFDDSVSVDDSNFQGDDEESVAESIDDTSVQDTAQLQESNGSGPSQENRYSTSSISRRAEQILANAKRRLTTMEGNLSRARSSLYITTPSMSSDGSTPSPPILRSVKSPGTAVTSPLGHSRMPSDNVIQNDAETPTIYPRRSASALGAAGGYRQPLSTSKSMDVLGSGPVRMSFKQSLNPHDSGLEPLSEDDVATDTQDTRDTQMKRESAQLDSFLSPTFGPASDRGLARPASAAQMRELKDHVKDLKGKISTLREQARADSLKRRSLQSLRTPSPFTHAKIDEWESEEKALESSDSGIEASDPSPWSGELASIDGDVAQTGADAKDQEAALEDDDESIISDYNVSTNGLRPPVTNGHIVLGSRYDADDPVPIPEADGDLDDMRTEDGFDPLDDEAVEAVMDGGKEAGQETGLNVNDEDYDSESGESTYHDAFQTPVSHEDREDAFDYEHFFLHSAMGTLSQQRMGRRGSFSSEDSVETTRGPIVEEQKEIRPSRHGRRGSVDTTSTTDSFETANEGGNSSRVSLVDPAAAVGQQPLDGAAEAKNASEINDDELSEMPTAGTHLRHNSAVFRTYSNGSVSGVGARSMHRPSISSFESTGTNRSFPLVNRAKLVNGADVVVPPPQQGAAGSAASPDHELRQISETIMSETASICDKEGVEASGAGAGDAALNQAPAMQILPGEDQHLVERLVSSLGRCVLGLSDAEKDSAQYLMYRRRVDAARRILEGLDGSS